MDKGYCGFVVNISPFQCIFLSDMKHFSEFDEIYGRYFSKPYPARMTVTSAGIYDNLDVELDAVVYLSNA